MEEIWIDVFEYEGLYQVSNLGTEEKASERYKSALVEFGIENNFAVVV